MSDDRDPKGRIPDPASTFLGAERRDESLFPSAVPDAFQPPPAPRRWDAASGRWVSHGGPVLHDPSDVPPPTRTEDPGSRFGFPKELSSAMPDEAPRSKGLLDRWLGWLRRFRSDRPR